MMMLVMTEAIKTVTIMIIVIMVVVADVFEQHIGPIFNSQAAEKEFLLGLLDTS